MTETKEEFFSRIRKDVDEMMSKPWPIPEGFKAGDIVKISYQGRFKPLKVERIEDDRD